MFSILGDISTQIFTLINGSIPTIMAFAWSMFNVIAVYQLIMICIRWELDLMDNHHWSRFHMSDVILFLMKVSAAGIMLTFYNSPLPGFGVNFHQLLPSIGQALASTVNQAGDAVVTDNLNNAFKNMPSPGFMNFVEIGTYLLLLMVVALFQMLLFVITAFGFIAVAVLSLTGALMIPLLLTKNFAKYFFTWLDQMVVYSMYPFIGAAFIFVLGNSLNNLLMRMFAGNVTFAQAILYLPVLLTMLGTFTFSVFQIPDFASKHFGGAGSVYSNMASGVEAYVTSKISIR